MGIRKVCCGIAFINGTYLSIEDLKKTILSKLAQNGFFVISSKWYAEDLNLFHLFPKI